MDVDIIRDGGIEFPEDVFPSLTSDQIAFLLAQTGASSLETSFNCVLIRRSDHIILVDAGCRDVMGESAGKLPETLDELGVKPSDIDKVIITHLHPDHISGALTADGQPVFFNAEMLLTEAERNYWANDANFAGADESGHAWRSAALNALDAYGDRVTLLDQDATVAGGIMLVPLPGHTPGHTGLMIEQGGSSLFYGSDVFVAQGIQLADATICTAFDIDQDQAISTRMKTMDMLATERMLMSSAHMLAPGLGYLERVSDGFAITQEA